MSFEIRNATQNDMAEVCNLLYHAFSISAAGKQILPKDLSTIEKDWHLSFKEYILDKRPCLYVLTDPSSEKPKEIIAFAKWIPPGLSRCKTSVPPLSFWPEGSRAELAHEVFTALVEVRKANMIDQEKNYWHLEMLAVREDYNDRGAARQLIKRHTDSVQVPCYLDCAEKDKSIYERYGFRELSRAQFHSPDGQFTQYQMIRDPPGQ